MCLDFRIDCKHLIDIKKTERNFFFCSILTTKNIFRAAEITYTKFSTKTRSVHLFVGSLNFFAFALETVCLFFQSFYFRYTIENIVSILIFTSNETNKISKTTNMKRITLKKEFGRKFNDRESIQHAPCSTIEMGKKSET